MIIIIITAILSFGTLNVIDKKVTENNSKLYEIKDYSENNE